MLNIAASKTIQKLSSAKHLSGLISVADGYINQNEHAQVGADLGARLTKKKKPGDKVWFAMVKRGPHKYIFYFVGNESRVLKKLEKVKDDC